ncbi:cilia- and flagella-associated protein 91 isoform X2 [Parasteatoda tepidariorum]|uniref:cilia- and flagella-associated protein 91 isoform X2 n=1 Tax=Parasteatoda tepidariorum TaxID=114398 RepID=UPI001C71E459|nr:uncharacterized protein LOC107454573 isoform X2 [Parasteatoda tepidariorum]
MEEEISGFSYLGSKRESYEISSNLLKYCHRPVKTLFNPGDVITDSEDETHVWEACGNIEYAEKTSKFESKETQTDYRESEAQTDPWDPPYKIIKIENEMQLKKLEEIKSSLMNELSQRSEKRGYILKNMWNRKKEEMKKKHDKLEGKLRKEINAIEHHLQNMEGDSSKIFTESENVEDPFVNVKNYILTEENMDYLQNNFSLSNFQDLLTIKDWLEKKQTVLKNKVPLTRLTRKTQRESLSEEAYQNYLAKKRTKVPPKVYHEDFQREEVPLPTTKPEDVAEFIDLDEKKIDMVTVWQQVLRGLAIQKQMLHLIEKHKEAIDLSLSEVTKE